MYQGIYQGIHQGICTTVYTRVYVPRYIPGCIPGYMYQGIYHGIPGCIPGYVPGYTSLERHTRIRRCAVLPEPAPPPLPSCPSGHTGVVDMYQRVYTTRVYTRVCTRVYFIDDFHLSHHFSYQGIHQHGTYHTNVCARAYHASSISTTVVVRCSPPHNPFMLLIGHIFCGCTRGYVLWC